MLRRQFPSKVKFICGFIYSQDGVYAAAKAKLKEKFGAIDFESEMIDFSFTRYYEQEMGKNLKRRFIALNRLKHAESFAKVKLYCINLEKKLAVNEKRNINIDPGYINEAKLVLTTTKDFSHRIYLGQGVFAEVTLAYSKKEFHHFPTTFPDYRTRQYKDIFLNIRNIYRAQIKHDA